MTRLKLYGVDCYSDRHSTQEELDREMKDGFLKHKVKAAVSSLTAHDLAAARIVIHNGFVRAEPGPEFIDPRLYQMWRSEILGRSIDHPTPGTFSLPD